MFSYREIITKGPFRGDNLRKHIGNLSISGVYVWRRTLPVNDIAVYDIDKFIEWFEKNMAVPFASAKNLILSSNDSAPGITLRSNLIKINHIEIGGERITEQKKIELQKFDTRTKRISLMNFLEKTMNSLGPVLYVGQAKNIKQRFEQHLSEDSPLQQKFRDLGISLSDTTVTFFLMPNAERSQRELLEQILTYLLVSPSTMRAG